MKLEFEHRFDLILLAPPSCCLEHCWSVLQFTIVLLTLASIHYCSLDSGFPVSLQLNNAGKLP